MKQRNKGFTLIELLVVIAIIGLLSSIVLVAIYNARSKGRDAKRVADMAQMANAMELYHTTYQGYPVGVNGSPQGVTGSFLSQLPLAPIPADGTCDTTTNPAGLPANSYYYSPSGNSAVINGTTVWSDYNYYFCIGNKTGDVQPGLRTRTPRGIN